jgi:hypothetical protein
MRLLGQRPGEPERRAPLGGHFLQEGRGIELAEIIAEFMNES